MDIDELVSDTFAAHTHLAPDPDDVMSAVHQRLSHRRSVGARPVAIAASAAVVVAVAGGATVLTHQHHQDATRPVQRAAAQSPTPAGPSHTSRAAASASIRPLSMPYDLGWLPAGSVTYLARRINVGAVSETSPPSFDGEYLLTVATADQVIDIDVQQMPGSLQGTRFKSGPGLATTVNGRPGIESKNSGGPGGYELYFLDSAGGLMYVNAMPHSDATVSAARLTDIGRTVARNVHFPGTTTVTPTFGLSYVPPGLSVRAFDVEAGTDVPATTSAPQTTTSYDLGTSTTQDSAATVATNALVPRGGTPGRPVSGHPTRYTEDHGYITFSVLGAVHGHAVAIQARLPLSEIYQIADGLVLPQ